MRGIIKALINSAAAGTLLLVVACGTEPDAHAPTSYQPTEPKYVLANVEQAFTAADARLLRGSLDNGFRFYFDPHDVGKKAENGYVMPPYWERDDFVAAVEGLCADTFSRTIETSWRACPVPDPGEVLYQAQGLDFALTIMTSRENGLRYDGGSCDYDFVRNAQEWTIKAWYDRTYQCGCGGDETSFGRILARYHPAADGR